VTKPQYEGFDLFSVENKPEAKEFYTTYTIKIPSQSNWLVMDRCNVTLAIYKDGLVNIERFSWFRIVGPMTDANKPAGHREASIAAQQEIWEWLVEWELVRLIPIGPEDSEYFATSKLTGDEAHDKRFGY
jgi:hypothetical protein